MSFKTAKTIRFFTGVLLPVPLFIAIFCFSYFYKSYHGYDFESRTYLTDQMSLSNSRKHIWTDIQMFLIFGYVVMLVPSVLYSISLEVYRARLSPSFSGYVTVGGTIGGHSSILFIWLNPGGFITDILHAFMAFIFSIGVGAAVATLLSLIGHPKLKRRAELRRDQAA